MKELPFIAGTLLLGVVLAVHLAMNGKVGNAIGNPQMANALFWCIGAVTAVIVGFTAREPSALGNLGSINPLLLTAGIMGALLVFAIAAMIPSVGAGRLFILLLTGQVITAMVMSHFGWLGSPEEPISLMKGIGTVLMIGGAAMVTLMD